MWERHPVGIKNRQTAIGVADVPRKFNDACIEQLAAIGQLPDSADRQRFASGIREAARVYARNTRALTAGEQRDEIAALYDAARRRQYDSTASLLTDLSPQVRFNLEDRLKLPGPRKAKLRLPSARTLRDPRRRDKACEMIEQLCRRGGSFIEGHMRPSGKRSITWQPALFAPVPNKHPPKREAERIFVMHLRAAWLQAVGRPPTATVNPSRSDRPFANLVRKCLELVCAPHADAIGLINELHRRKLGERKRLADLRRRQRREARETKKAF